MINVIFFDHPDNQVFPVLFQQTYSITTLKKKQMRDLEKQTDWAGGEEISLLFYL